MGLTEGSNLLELEKAGYKQDFRTIFLVGSSQAALGFSSCRLY
jgi:hypothetical protein